MNSNGLNDLQLLNQALSRARMPEPQAEASRTARQIAIRALRRQARNQGIQ
ncbi:hypothetical protein F4553_005082 [Allocatelliglobosispora scoriae]|uniref:Uncharacterized protein n=1 Tax=Allocatelliglobosispora scoriae TaxID=643052 RepID=A0A841BXP5_9ACTN|nr:hypothetical protein [Allocatelliglobosispora scoriae]MBB5871703.1 hypothetical protein [Allocatelliglobosispora scoriae]